MNTLWSISCKCSPNIRNSSWAWRTWLFMDLGMSHHAMLNTSHCLCQRSWLRLMPRRCSWFDFTNSFVFTNAFLLKFTMPRKPSHHLQSHNNWRQLGEKIRVIFRLHLDHVAGSYGADNAPYLGIAASKAGVNLKEVLRRQQKLTVRFNNNCEWTRVRKTICRQYAAHKYVAR